MPAIRRCPVPSDPVEQTKQVKAASDIVAVVGTYLAIKPAGKRGRIHVFLGTSKIHREFKLNKAQDEILRLAVESVKRAKALVADVEFSPEDASRTELDFLVKVVEAAGAARDEPSVDPSRSSGDPWTIFAKSSVNVSGLMRSNWREMPIKPFRSEDVFSMPMTRWPVRTRGSPNISVA
jgi:hypothetical protein